MSLDFIKSCINELKSYFVVTKVKYSIIGECSRCGNCCRQVRCYGLKNENELKIMSLFFPYYKNFYVSGKDENGNLILTCNKINDKNECGIYEKRPLVCRNYPKKYIKTSMELPQGCSYKIVKKEFKDFLCDINEKKEY